MSSPIISESHKRVTPMNTQQIPKVAISTQHPPHFFSPLWLPFINAHCPLALWRSLFTVTTNLEYAYICAKDVNSNSCKVSYPQCFPNTVDFHTVAKWSASFPTLFILVLLVIFLFKWSTYQVSSTMLCTRKADVCSIKNMNSRTKWPEFKSWIHYLLTIWSCENYLADLCLSFLLCIKQREKKR